MRIPSRLAALTIVLALGLGAVLLVHGLTRDAGAGDAKAASRKGARHGPALRVDPGAPVVEVVFDELPTATLMTPSGSRIDAKRFPGFAKLAAHSTWYRNNTTVADFTGRAVPAIETGISPDWDTLPIASQQPHSIFTLLGGRYRFNVHEPVTKVCPRSLCGGGSARSSEPGASASLTAGQFAQDAFVPPKPHEFERWLARVKGGRSLNFIHMEVPHEPFHFLPNGRSYNYSPISDVGNYNAQRWAGGVGGTATTWQRHYIQTGYADTLVGKTIKRLRRLGIWKRALVIVTADHGISFDPGTYRRLAVPGNFGAIANPPLFVKYPGQKRGEISELHTRSVDIVPTTAQVLGLDLPYKTDGVPISDEGMGGTITLTTGFKTVASLPFDHFLAERRAVLRSAARQLGARTGLFQLGPRPQLVGRRTSRGLARSVAIDGHLDLGDVVFRKGGKVPAFVNGTIAPSAAGHVLAIAVNGRIVATCRAFRFQGRTRWGAVVPPSALRQGANSVAVFRIPEG
jgi:hypothetical protein